MSNTPSLRKKLLFSVGVSAILLVVVYAMDNYAFPFLESTQTFTFIESRIQSPKRGAVSIDTSRIFINVGYDAALVETRHGNEKITDREALVKLLKDLETKTEYKEIFIDIRFEKGLNTPYDSVLVESILTMPNTFAVKHWDYNERQDAPLIDERLLDQAGYADYSGSIFNSSFSRYEFLQHNGSSAALRLYNDIDGRTIKRHGWRVFSIYTDKGKLCNNASFIRIPEDMSPRVLRYRGDQEHTFRYYNLSEDIYGLMALDPSMQERFFNDCKDKIIVIGDFISDQHDTYFNKQPGPYLNYLAYSTLRDGKHIVKWWIALIAFLVYSITLLFIVLQKSPVRWMVSWIKSRLVSFLASLFGYTVLLSIVSLLLFITTGRVLSIFVPSLLFTLIDDIYRYKKYDEN